MEVELIFLLICLVPVIVFAVVAMAVGIARKKQQKQSH